MKWSIYFSSRQNCLSALHMNEDQGETRSDEQNGKRKER
jgi:hypothetical protein